MPQRTPFARLRAILPVSAGLLLWLAAGCQSTKPTYSFRPAAAQSVAARPALQPDSAENPADSATPIAAETLPPAARAPRRAGQTARPLAQLPQRTLRRANLLAGGKLQSRPTRRALRQLTAAPRHRTETAEVGLGTTVLGVLGLIVLPISVVGLLIWGGPVWAILAGLAALAVLVAYIDPFR